MKSKVWRSVRIVSAGAVLGVLGWSSYTMVLYVRSSPRFEVKQFAVSGLRRVQEGEVLAEAGLQLGSNVFNVDLQQMRERVETLPWVRYARVQRILPDKILIKIVEREPAGLARIGSEIFQFDSDGVILSADALGAAGFPVLDGLRANNGEANRQKVDLYRRVINDLKDQTELSEIHISDSMEVSVVSTTEPQLVVLGTGEFRTRWSKYVPFKPQIQQEFPDAVRVDLRFANQVIVKMSAQDVEERVIWRAENNSL